jgi:hypothetical protein
MRIGLLAAIGTLAAATSAFATSYTAVIRWFDLSRQDERQLERMACWEPHRLALQYSVGSGSGIADDEEEKYPDIEATVACHPHTHIDGYPGVFEVECARTRGAWKCESPVEVLEARFPQGFILITAEKVPLREAYDAVAWFVRNKAFEPAKILFDPLRRSEEKFDNCSVRSFEGVLVVHCQIFEARVKRTEDATGARSFVRQD